MLLELRQNLRNTGAGLHGDGPGLLVHTSAWRNSLVFRVQVWVLLVHNGLGFRGLGV